MSPSSVSASPSSWSPRRSHTPLPKCPGLAWSFGWGHRLWSSPRHFSCMLRLDFPFGYWGVAAVPTALIVLFQHLARPQVRSRSLWAPAHSPQQLPYRCSPDSCHDPQSLHLRCPWQSRATDPHPTDCTFLHIQQDFRGCPACSTQSSCSSRFWFVGAVPTPYCIKKTSSHINACSETLVEYGEDVFDSRLLLVHRNGLCTTRRCETENTKRQAYNDFTAPTALLSARMQCMYDQNGARRCAGTKTGNLHLAAVQFFFRQTRVN